MTSGKLKKYSLVELEEIFNLKKQDVINRILRFVNSGRIKDVEKGDYVSVDRLFFIKNININTTAHQLKYDMLEGKYTPAQLEEIYHKLINSKNIYI